MARKNKAAKRMRRALEAPLMRLGLAVAPRLPRRAVLALARALGAAAYWFSARNRRLGMENLDLAFGDEKTRAEKRLILKKSLQNFSLTMLDVLWFTRDSERKMARWFEAAPSLSGAMEVRAARVGVTGHFGNWELMGRYWALKCGGIMSVAMPAKNAAVDALLVKARENNGQVVVAREGALKKLTRHLRGGGTTGLLLDQNTSPEEGGIFVDFFGKPAAMSPAAGVLASMADAEIVFGYALVRPDGSYLGEIPHRIAAGEVAGLERGTAGAEVARRIAGFYEEAIRAHPEGWLWCYKRWRHVPQGASAAGFPSYAKQQGE